MQLNTRSPPIDKTYRLIGFKPGINRSYRKKLLSFGFTRGIEFTILRVAPLGDPIEVRLRGFSVTLRKDELDTLIAVEKQTECNDCTSCH